MTLRVILWFLCGTPLRPEKHLCTGRCLSVLDRRNPAISPNPCKVQQCNMFDHQRMTSHFISPGPSWTPLLPQTHLGTDAPGNRHLLIQQILIITPPRRYPVITPGRCAPKLVRFETMLHHLYENELLLLGRCVGHPSKSLQTTLVGLAKSLCQYFYQNIGASATSERVARGPRRRQKKYTFWFRFPASEHKVSR